MYNFDRRQYLLYQCNSSAVIRLIKLLRQDESMPLVTVELYNEDSIRCLVQIVYKGDNNIIILIHSKWPI